MISLRELFARVRLEYKILLVLALGLILGFGSYVVYTVQSESAALLDEYRLKSRLFAESLKSGVRHMMLSGRPSFVRSLIREAREEFRGLGRLRVYDNEAREIFAEAGTFTVKEVSDSVVHSLVRERREPHTVPSPFVLLPNEKACQFCHGTDHAIRGLLELEFAETGDPVLKLAGRIAVEAFRALMLSGKGDSADELVRAIQREEEAVTVQVYDRNGYYVAFGDDAEEVPGAILERALTMFQNPGPTNSVHMAGWRERAVLVFPLFNDQACQVCHGSDHSLRGMFVLWAEGGETPASSFPRRVAVSGFKTMMIMQRGMYAADYVQMVRTLPFVKSFRAYDNGRNHPGGWQVQELYVPNPRFTEREKDPSVDELILRANREGEAGNVRAEMKEEMGDGVPYLTQIIPLLNDEKCQACHPPPEPGDPRYERYKDRWKVRSAVKVSTSMAPVMGTIRRNLYASVGVGLLTIVVVAGVLRVFMKLVVLNPLALIGGTAQQVGEGNLAVRARVPSRDEIGTLADQINRMIQGLRERLHLTKFVSNQTVQAVRTAELEGVALGGVRKEATVLFSDIRGFTAFSEGVEPEQVVEMLNIFLNEQAQIVREYNGDIDKFVGDELMAVFQDEAMVEDAVRCSIALQEKIGRLNDAYHVPMKVGIGINAGPMVMGAVGSADRMDYTVLGDAVNVGSRLCSVARPGEILISGQAAALLPEGHGFSLRARDPVRVKGKSRPLDVYEVAAGP